MGISDVEADPLKPQGESESIAGFTGTNRSISTQASQNKVPQLYVYR
jgi:hypothetical protein